jgi:hypothetical protein
MLTTTAGFAPPALGKDGTLEGALMTRATKPVRKHNPKWKDATRTQRSDKRKTELQAAAIRDGFTTWSEAITAWKNGEAVLVRKQS